MPTKDDVYNILKNINDPEMMIDIVTLELIRNVDIKGDIVDIKMTLTSPMCPFGPQLMEEIKAKLRDGINGIKDAKVELSFDPPWEPSPELRATLGA